MRDIASQMGGSENEEVDALVRLAKSGPVTSEDVEMAIALYETMGARAQNIANEDKNSRVPIQLYKLRELLSPFASSKLALEVFQLRWSPLEALVNKLRENYDSRDPVDFQKQVLTEDKNAYLAYDLDYLIKNKVWDHPTNRITYFQLRRLAGVWYWLEDQFLIHLMGASQTVGLPIPEDELEIIARKVGRERFDEIQTASADVAYSKRYRISG